MLSVIQPPNSGPTTGATSVVMPHRASAVPASARGKLDSSRVCDSGIIGPATRPCSTRKNTSISSDVAKPHSQEVMTNSSTLMLNRRTAPKRCVSHPVSGTEMALATPKLVMTQVPWPGLTPRSPAMAGMDTLAIDESSTFMNVASDSASVPSSSVEPVSGGCCAGGVTGVALAGAGAPVDAWGAAGLAAVMQILA